MTEIPTLVQTIQTSRACPAQWSAWDADGNYYYLRFRFGRGTIHRSVGGPPPGAGHQAFVDALDGAELLAGFVHGDELLGSISLEEFLDLARAA